jgi:hypothetical protein
MTNEHGFISSKTTPTMVAAVAGGISSVLSLIALRQHGAVAWADLAFAACFAAGSMLVASGKSRLGARLLQVAATVSLLGLAQTFVLHLSRFSDPALGVELLFDVAILLACRKLTATRGAKPRVRPGPA